jgi:hypothetical protein
VWDLEERPLVWDLEEQQAAALLEEKAFCEFFVFHQEAVSM